MVTKELMLEVTYRWAISQLEKRDVVYLIEHSVLNCIGLSLLPGSGIGYVGLVLCVICASVKEQLVLHPCLRVFILYASVSNPRVILVQQ